LAGALALLLCVLLLTKDLTMTFTHGHLKNPFGHASLAALRIKNPTVTCSASNLKTYGHLQRFEP
jgi:hypothetical protein